MPVYDEKYIKARVREFNSVIKTNYLGDEIPRESMHYTCIACITINSVMRRERKLSLSLFRRVQIQIKENKDDQIHKHWDRIRIRVRVRVRIWNWIKVKVWFWIWHCIIVFNHNNFILTHILSWWNSFTKFCCQRRFLTTWIYLVLFLKKKSNLVQKSLNTFSSV